MTELITDTLKVIFGFCVFLGVLAIPELLADWMAENAPDWLWMLLFMAIPVGLVVYLWKWYRTVESEATERGDHNAGACTTDRS